MRRVSCRSCGAVKREHLPWLANNPFYTKRFAFYVGRRCRASTIRDVARELRLDWRTVKSLEMEYMREQLRRAGTPGPKVIGIDELSVGRGHNYRIIVSDLVRGRPIWFGGTDRSEKSMDLFFQWLGPRKCKGIRLAVMDMWKPFRNSTLKAGNAPQAGILYDKFHILKKLNEALDKVRKSEYARLSGKDRRVHQGPEVHIAVPLGQPEAGGASVVEGAVRGEQEVEQGLSAQGDVQPTVGLQARGVGAAVLRALEVGSEVAAPQAVREVRPDGRGPLGRDRVVLPGGEQGAAWGSLKGSTTRSA